jgi:hypothetical protein
MALSKVDLANQVENQLPQNLVANNLPFRNIIINGDMSIAQRSTSVASITASSYNTVDRFRTNISSAGTWTQSQSTTVPSGQGFATSLKMDCTTADASLGATDIISIQTRFEGQNLQYLKKGTASAESLTLSFWVKSNKTGTYICELYDNDNTRHIAKSYTISSADTWEKKTITYAGDTSGTLGNDNGDSFRVNFHLAAGSDYTSGTLATSWSSYTAANRAVGQVNLADSTANEWYITGVQLEAGTTASDFEFLPVDVNLGRCERYCQVIGDTTDANVPYAVGMANSTANFRGVYSFKKEMRATPSATVSSASDFRIFENGTANVITALSFNQVSKRSCQVDADTSGLVQGQACIFRKLTSQDSAKVTLDAEL